MRVDRGPAEDTRWVEKHFRSFLSTVVVSETPPLEPVLVQRVQSANVRFRPFQVPSTNRYRAAAMTRATPRGSQQQQEHDARLLDAEVSSTPLLADSACHDSTGRSGWKVLTRLPAQLGGITLNLVGLPAWLSALAELHPAFEPIVAPFTAAAVGLAAVLTVAAVARVILAPSTVRTELGDAKPCGSHGALLMTLTLLTAHLPRDQPARVAFDASYLLQVVMVLWYLPPVQGRGLRPFCFPPRLALVRRRWQGLGSAV